MMFDIVLLGGISRPAPSEGHPSALAQISTGFRCLLAFLFVHTRRLAADAAQ